MLGMKKGADTGAPASETLVKARLAAAKAFVDALEGAERALNKLRAADESFHSADPAKCAAMSEAQRQFAHVLPLFLLGHMQFETPELFRLLRLNAVPASARGNLYEHLARQIASERDI